MMKKHLMYLWALMSVQVENVYGNGLPQVTKTGETEDGYPIVNVVTSSGKDAGDGWIPYMIKGIHDCDMVSTLSYGQNVNGFGDVKALNLTGYHKMAENIFDSFMFQEVLAVDSFGDWMSFRYKSYDPFTADIAFDSAKTSSNVIRGKRSDGMEIEKTPKYNSGGGPIIVDPFAGYNWMLLRDNLCNTGTVMGKGVNGDFNTEAWWWWFGRNRKPQLTKIGETEGGYPIVNVVTSTNKDAGSGWIPYMIKAESACTFGNLFSRDSAAGLGNVKALPLTGTHKMAENTFQSFEFQEVLAVDSFGDWMSFKYKDNYPFTAEIAFDDVKSTNIVKVKRDDGEVVEKTPSPTNKGPIINDPFDGRNAMFYRAGICTTGSVKGDSKHGGVPTKGWWWWFGRYESSTSAWMIDPGMIVMNEDNTFENPIIISHAVGKGPENVVVKLFTTDCAAEVTGDDAVTLPESSFDSESRLFTYKVAIDKSQFKPSALVTSNNPDTYSDGTIAFCTKVATLLNAGGEEVSFRETNYVLTYDLTNVTFGETFSVTADEVVSIDEEFATDYTINACECSANSFTCVNEPPPVTQNNPVYLCLETSHEDIEFSNLRLTFTKGDIAYNPVTMGTSSWVVNNEDLTVVTEENNKVRIQAFLFAGLFDGEGNDVTASGVAALSFNSGEKEINEVDFSVTITIDQVEKEDMMFFGVDWCFE